METLKNLPIGLQNFEKLRKENFLYVDKTAFIHKLVNTGCYYFLSRPRRFGKSLLLSTFHAYFEGKKWLFEGTQLERLEKDWLKYPVLHLDLNVAEYKSPDALYNKLSLQLSEWESLYGRNELELSLGDRFCGVIRRAAQAAGRGVVILVDEYDKPILQSIGREELQTEYRSTLKGFYGALKSMDGYIKFAFLTGVTKFGKVSVFSDLNNLEDISMSRQYAAICGITDSELDTIFPPYLERLSQETGLDLDTIRGELRQRYDGYRFLENSVPIYNPFSVLNTFKNNRFSSFWFETGTPSYLVYLLKKHHYNLQELTSVETDAFTLNNIDSQSSDPIPVIYQSGYLTIKSYDPEFELYKLGFPNKEVEDGFMRFLMPYYTPIEASQSSVCIARFVRDVKEGNVDQFMQRLSSLFADTPYELVKELENHYQNVLFIVYKLMGFYVKAEYHTSQGRIDLMLQTPAYTYIFEFKFNGTAEAALSQIKEKNYAAPFLTDPDRRIILVGVNFSSATRNIDAWLTSSL